MDHIFDTSHKMMPLPQIHKFFSGIGTRCRQLLCLKSPPPSRAIEISAPFNFKEGPAIHFPGYSEDDISLMRENALPPLRLSRTGDSIITLRKWFPGHGEALSAVGLGRGWYIMLEGSAKGLFIEHNNALGIILEWSWDQP